MTARVGKLLAVNALIRAAGAASGQLFAFLLAARVGHRVGAGAEIVGTIAAAYFVAELAGAPLAGRLADRVGAWRVLRLAPLFGVAALLLATAGAAIAGAVAGALAATLLVARLSEGLSAASAVPPTITLLARATDRAEARRMRVMGAFEVTSLLGMIAGFALGGLAWQVAGAGAFATLIPLYVAAWSVIGRGRASAQPVARGPHAQSSARTLLALFGSRANAAFATTWLAVNAVVGAWVQQAPYLFSLPERSASQTLVGGYNGPVIGGIFAVWGFTFLAGIGGWSLLGAAWRRRRAMAVGLLGMVGVALTLALVNHGASRAFLFATAGFVLIESGITPAAFAYLAGLTERADANRGVVLGVYSLLLGSGQLLGSAVGTPFVVRWQMDGLLAATALLAVVGLAGVTLMRGSPAAD